MGNQVFGISAYLEVEDRPGQKPTGCRQKHRHYAKLIQLLDDRSLALVMRDAKDDGKKALEILRGHYLSQRKPKVIAL